MTFGKNLFAGMAGSVWVAIVGFAAVPFYLKYLGIEAYGLIGFFAAMQVVFQLFDLGMAPTLNREMARCSAIDQWDDARGLLHTLATIYWCMAVAIAAAMITLAPLIADSWLKSRTISRNEVTHAVMLMGLVAACRWPIGIYQGVLTGLQRLIVVSVVSASITTVTSLGAIAILIFVSPTITAFFLWQGFMGLCYALLMRYVAWRAVGGGQNVRFSVAKLRLVWKFSLSMTALAGSALVFTQLDKVLLSRLLSLDAFGRYSLATIVAGTLNVFIAPCYNAVFPRLSMYVAQHEVGRLIQTYRRSLQLLSAILFTLAAFFCVFAQDVVRIWTGNDGLAVAVAPLIGLLATGTALHGVMYVPHALQLAFGRTSIPLTINGVLLVLIVPMMISLTLSYGAVGGALSWLVLHALYLLLGMYLTYRYVLKEMRVAWLLRDIGLPLVIALLGVALVGSLVQMRDWFVYARLGVGIVLAALSICLSIVLIPEVRLAIAERLGINKSKTLYF